MDNNIFGIADEQKNKAVQKVKNGVQKYLIFIVLLFNIALEVVSKLYAFGLHSPFTAQFFSNLSVSLATTMICYACFIPFGRGDEAKRNNEFLSLSKLWYALSDTVREGYLRLFEAFCKEQVTDERTEAKKAILANDTIIPYDEYKEKYEGKSKKYINSLADLNKREKKAINKANGYGLFNATKIKPINPTIVLSGHGKKHVNDAGRNEKSYAISYLAKKPIIIFFSAVVLNSISTTFTGGGTNVILDMLFSVFQIVIASVFGYSAGVTDFKHEIGKINNRVIFISLFCEQNKIQVKTPSK